ncbi:MAG: DUF3991 domain-containing protein [Ruminiclostridium sp.]|nr:DUF3991 domain-containing protein [Ruminiclostridium sp.]
MVQTAMKTLHFTEEQIEQANRVNLVELAQQHGFKLENGGRKALHAHNSGGLYIFKDSNRFYHWGSDSKGGAIDFVMRYSCKTFAEAVAQLIGENYEPYLRESTHYIKEEKGPLLLPEKAQNFKRVYWYLISVRGIEPEIISYFMNVKMLYQEAKYGNCVFIGYNADGTPKYCAMRSSNEKSGFKMDAENSDKSYPFYNEGKSNLLIVNESPIDLMSHATLAKIFYGKDWKEDHRISLGCLWDGALERYLQSHPDIKRIVFAVDNDYLSRSKDGVFTNWGQQAAAKWCGKYGKKGYECAVHRPHLKDFNKDLTEMRKGRTPKDLDSQRATELQAEFEKVAVEEPLDEQEDEYER